MRVTFYEEDTKAGYVDVPEDVVRQLALRLENCIADAEIDSDGTKWLNITEDITIDKTNIEFTCEVQFDCACLSQTLSGDNETPGSCHAWLEIKNIGVVFYDCTAYFPNGKECECAITKTSDLERAISRTITTADYDYWG